MYEVKIVVPINVGNGSLKVPITLASFDGPGEVGPNYSRGKALEFAKKITDYEVSVVYVPDEDNRDKAFGVIYARVPA